MPPRFDSPAKAKAQTPEEKLQQWANEHPEEYARFMGEAEKAEEVKNEDALHPEHRAETLKSKALAAVHAKAMMYLLPRYVSRDILDQHGAHIQEAMEIIEPFRRYGVTPDDGLQIIQEADTQIHDWYEQKSRALNAVRLQEQVDRYLAQLDRDAHNAETELEYLEEQGEINLEAEEAA